MANSNKGLTSEDIVIIIVMAFGFLGGLVILKMGFQPIIVSVLFGTGIASLVYRFLGGLSGENTVNLGPVKIVGALAALIGAAWIIDFKLEKQISNPNSITEIAISPSTEKWFGVDKKGLPVSISVNEKNIHPPSDGLKDNLLSLKHDGDRVHVFDPENENFSFGFFKTDAFKDLEKGLVFNNFSKDSLSIGVTPKLNPLTEPFNFKNEKIPFKINVTAFGSNKSYFELLSNENNDLMYEGNIELRGAKVIEIGGDYYFLSIYSVSHQGSDIGAQYAKFLVGKLMPELK